MAVKEKVCFEKNMTVTVESYIGKVGGKEGVKLRTTIFGWDKMVLNLCPIML